MKGAGGTEGGTAKFLIGLVMMIAGGYVFLKSIHVTNHWSFGHGFSFGGMQLTTGMVLVPFLFGMGMVFFNAKNYFGWFLVAATLIMVTFGIISSIKFRLERLSLFDLLMMLGLLAGGIGLFANSLKDVKARLRDMEEEDAKLDSDRKA